FLEGGLMWMEGYGERLTATQVDPRYALAIAVPNLELSTALVYRTWDRLDYPLGPSLPDRALPPTLRGLAPLRNDLTPAGLHLHPELGDFMTDLTGAWERPVAMSGSGPAVFGLFPDLDEAAEAAAATPRGTRAARGVLPRKRGVARRPDA
ncbi:MAG: hypothetical protein ACT4OP_10655, partial [Actinomycetota bacterium]